MEHMELLVNPNKVHIPKYNKILKNDYLGNKSRY